eukprot:12201568-Ditylum_brightwellii.AAC.1
MEAMKKDMEELKTSVETKMKELVTNTVNELVVDIKNYMVQMKGTMDDSIKNIKQEVGNIQNIVNTTIVGINKDMGTLKTDVKTEVGSLRGE